jgi:multiple sugar transport system substrate-binding protein
VKRSQKGLALFTALLLVAVTASGCGRTVSAPTNKTPAVTQSSAKAGSSTVAKDTPATIRVAWWGNQVRNDNTVSALNLYSKEHPNVKFETEFTDWTGYWDKVATQAAANSLSDILQMDYSYIKQYQSKAQLAGLSVFTDSGILNLSDVGSIIESGKINGELYGIPLGMNAPAMIYDKEAAAKAGVEIRNGMTREEFISIADKVYDATGKKFDWAYYDGALMLDYFVRGLGFDLMEEGKLGIASADNALDFFKTIEDSMKKPAHMTKEELTEAVGIGIEQDPLSVGKNWLAFAASNQLVAHNDGAGKELGIVIFPVGANDKEKAMFQKPSMFFCISKNSEKKEVAAQILDFFTNSIEANKILMGERGVPISNTVASTIKPLMPKANQQVFDYLLDIGKYCSVISPPAPVGSSEIASLVNTITEQVCYGQITSEEAAERFFTEGNAILKKAAQ